MINIKNSNKKTELFLENIGEILKCDKVLEMDNFVQHGDISCLSHSIFVAYMSYKISIFLKLDLNYKALIRGAMLHDFFLYDWRSEGISAKSHTFLHPKVALLNAQTYFDITDLESSIITSHMFPLSPKIPKSKEAVIVNIADTLCAALEFCRVFSRLKKLKLLTSFAIGTSNI